MHLHLRNKDFLGTPPSLLPSINGNLERLIRCARVLSAQERKLVFVSLLYKSQKLYIHVERFRRRFRGNTVQFPSPSTTILLIELVGVFLWSFMYTYTTQVSDRTLGYGQSYQTS